MLFNSYIFIAIFLPVVLIVFFMIGGQGHHRIAISWLVAASLFFYAWWNPIYLGLILASIFFNYSLGVALGGGRNNSDGGKSSNRYLLAFGVASNLFLLGYFKYANFFVENLNSLAGSDFNLEKIILPLAISFFTFQQIAYLVDAYEGKTREYNFLHYCLFVTFFPQLIAGPIVHHREMLPQFMNALIYKADYKNLSTGLSIFVLGLFKKVVLADGIAIYASSVFEAAETGSVLSFFESWGGALSYTFQLYFDFSGYSDMAIGIAIMFGIRLPLNFNSPYKATSIIDFWRGWHITLSRFLRDYLYIPLGGNRKGKARRHMNLMLTMLIGGLWHGAGWTFLVWGGLHGLYLIINHSWRSMCTTLFDQMPLPLGTGVVLSRLLTFTAVVIAWVFFRAQSFDGAIVILKAMAGMNGVVIPGSIMACINKNTIFLGLLFCISFFAPNTYQFMDRYPVALNYEPDYRKKNLFKFGFNIKSCILISILAFISLLMIQSVQKAEFLYYDF